VIVLSLCLKGGEHLNRPISFFLGSKSANGFTHYFHQLTHPQSPFRTLILKGGPGSGKSTLIRRIAAELEAMGHRVERILCASDFESLDALIDHTAHAAMVDGTAPHVLDPTFPGARDSLLPMGELWDEDALRSARKDILALNEQIAQCHARADAYCAAAGTLLACCRKAALTYVDTQAIREFLSGLDAFEPDCDPCIQTRLLSAVSVGQTPFLCDTLNVLCPKRYVIRDSWGAAADALLKTIDAAAGTSRILCPCSLNPHKLEHLLFPDLGIGFSCSNAFHDASDEHALLVEGLSKPIPQAQTEQMTVMAEDAAALIHRAEEQIANAKALHDELEAYYVSAMDFSGIESYHERAMEFLTQEEA